MKIILTVLAFALVVAAALWLPRITPFEQCKDTLSARSKRILADHSEATGKQLRMYYGHREALAESAITTAPLLLP